MAKAKPIINSGSTSVITYSRWMKKTCTTAAVGEEGGGGGAPGAGAEIHLQPVVKTMVRQAVPLQPMEVHSGADIHLQPVEAHRGPDIYPVARGGLHA